MKLNLSSLAVLSTILLAASIMIGCKESNAQNGDNHGIPDCAVQLFDGDNYKDDTIVIDGPGEFPNLENLPGADKNWNDEGDSFKAGKNATVTFWTKTNFQGDSITFKKGEQRPSVDEPSSMKIKCD